MSFKYNGKLSDISNITEKELLDNIQHFVDNQPHFTNQKDYKYELDCSGESINLQLTYKRGGQQLFILTYFYSTGYLSITNRLKHELCVFDKKEQRLYTVLPASDVMTILEKVKNDGFSYYLPLEVNKQVIFTISEITLERFCTLLSGIGIVIKTVMADDVKKSNLFNALMHQIKSNAGCDKSNLMNRNLYSPDLCVGEVLDYFKIHYSEIYFELMNYHIACFETDKVERRRSIDNWYQDIIVTSNVFGGFIAEHIGLEKWLDERLDGLAKQIVYFGLEFFPTVADPSQKEYHLLKNVIEKIQTKNYNRDDARDNARESAD